MQYGSKKINPTGRHHTEETKQKISEAHKGKKFSSETIEKMRQNNLGERNNMYGTKWTDERRNAVVKRLSKPVVATLPNGEQLNFNSVKECKIFFYNNYHIASSTIKKLLRTNQPLNLPYKERNHYPYVYKMNGLCIRYDEVK